MANTGDIPTNITFSAGQVIRRNASDKQCRHFGKPIGNTHAQRHTTK